MIKLGLTNSYFRIFLSPSETLSAKNLLQVACFDFCSELLHQRKENSQLLKTREYYTNRVSWTLTSSGKMR